MRRDFESFRGGGQNLNTSGFQTLMHEIPLFIRVYLLFHSAHFSPSLDKTSEY